MTQFEQLFDLLEQLKTPDEEKMVILAEIMKAASLKLYTQLFPLLTAEERQQLAGYSDSEDDEIKMNQFLDQCYEKYYHQTVDQAIDELQEQFAINFLTKYKLSQIVESDDSVLNIGQKITQVLEEFKQQTATLDSSMPALQS